MINMTKGEREMADVLAQHGGIPADEIGAQEHDDEVTGYYKAIRALVDAGLRSAWKDNEAAGAIVAGAGDERELVDALAKHSGFTSEFLADIAEGAGAEGKAGAQAAQAKGYERACKAMAAAGFRGAWVDDRKQAVGNSHGWIDRNDI